MKWPTIPGAPSVDQMPLIPDVLAFSDAASTAALGGKVPDLQDVASLGAQAETIINKARDFAADLPDQIQRWITTARDAPQFFEDGLQQLRDIAAAAFGQAGAGAALSFWSGIVNTAITLQRARADANLRETIRARKIREAAALAYFVDFGWASEFRSGLPYYGATPIVRDVGGGEAPSICGAFAASPFALEGLMSPQRKFYAEHGGAAALMPADTQERRCNIEKAWEDREGCPVYNRPEDRDAVVVCTPWAWPLATDRDWCSLGAVSASAPEPDPEIWLPVAGLYTIASPAHLQLHLEPVLRMRALLRKIILQIGQGWYIGPAWQLQRLAPGASWPRYGAWITERDWPLPNAAAPNVTAIRAALARIDRVLAVRRWTVEHFWELPQAWRDLAITKNGAAPAPLGYATIPPKPSASIPPLPPAPPPDNLATAL